MTKLGATSTQENSAKLSGGALLPVVLSGAEHRANALHVNLLFLVYFLLADNVFLFPCPHQLREEPSGVRMWHGMY